LAGAQRAGQARGALADDDHRIGVEIDPGRLALVHGLPALRLAQSIQDRRFGPGHRRDQLGADLRGAVAQERGDGPRGQPTLAVGLAEPEEDRAGLFLGLEADQQNRARLLQLGVRHPLAVEGVPGAGHGVHQEVGLLGRMLPSPEIDVVGAEHDPGELGVRVGVLEG
jgi:hypothetical protein